MQAVRKNRYIILAKDFETGAPQRSILWQPQRVAAYKKVVSKENEEMIFYTA